MGFDRTSQGIGRLGSSLEDLFRGIADRKQKESDRAAHGRFVKNAFDLIDAPDPATFEPEMIEPESPGLLDYGPDGAPQYMDGRPAPVEPEIPRKKLGQRDLIQMYMLDAEDPAPQNVDFLKQISDILNQDLKASATKDQILTKGDLSFALQDLKDRNRANLKREGWEFEEQENDEDRAAKLTEIELRDRGAYRRESMRLKTMYEIAAITQSSKSKIPRVFTPEEADQQILVLQERLGRLRKNEPVWSNYISESDSPFRPSTKAKLKAHAEATEVYAETEKEIEDAIDQLRLRKIELMRGHGGPAPAGADNPMPGAAPSPATGSRFNIKSVKTRP